MKYTYLILKPFKEMFMYIIWRIWLQEWIVTHINKIKKSLIRRWILPKIRNVWYTYSRYGFTSLQLIKIWTYTEFHSLWLNQWI